MNIPLLIILDIDETLVYASTEQLDYSHDFDTGFYKIYKRPFLDDFLDLVFENFHVGFWSSASNGYVKKVVENLIGEEFHPKFVWARSRCTFFIRGSVKEKNSRESHFNYVKKLSKVEKKFGNKPNRMLIIDDTPHKAMHNMENAIIPKSWTGNRDDDELSKLANYLLKIKDVPDVRQIEKTNWRSEIIEDH